MTRERWGASKFVKNQLRCIADNSYEPDVMPDISADLSTDGTHATITLLQYTEVLKPFFGILRIYRLNIIYERYMTLKTF